MPSRSQPFTLTSRTIESPEGSEVYLTAEAQACDAPAERAHEVYRAIAEQLTVRGYRVFCERVFATADAVRDVLAERNEVMRALDDGVGPTAIVVDEGAYGRFAGVQVHAVRCASQPEAMTCYDACDRPIGRRLRLNGHTWLYVNGLSTGTEVGEAEQARRMFACAGCCLRQAGGSMRSVARTWLWLKDVCGWYDELNATRNRFFKSEGLIDTVKRVSRLPASTGIGLYGADGAACTLDLIALPGREDEIEFIEAGGDQRSAFEYGSAFSRASMAPMPGGRTVFISGTAAIDPAGETEHVDQVEAQVDDTVAHVRSLLGDCGCGDEHVLMALVYCKTPRVERVFRERYGGLDWPHVTMIGDVCRPELLFEVEVTASPTLSVEKQMV